MFGSNCGMPSPSQRMPRATSATAASAAAVAAIRLRLERPRPGDGGSGVLHAWMNSVAVAGRSAGTLANPRATASDSADETPGLSSSTGEGGSVRWRTMTARAVRPVKGGSPVSIW